MRTCCIKITLHYAYYILLSLLRFDHYVSWAILVCVIHLLEFSLQNLLLIYCSTKLSWQKKMQLPKKLAVQYSMLPIEFRQLMTSQILRFILDQALKQWLTGRKIGEDGNTKIWISGERKEPFRWNKKHLS